MDNPGVFDLKELVSYQKGSIVSHQVIKKENGTITVFAFDEGQELSEHTSPFSALVNLLDGTAEIFLAGKGHTLRAGESILLPANQPHALKAIEKFKMQLTLIKS